MGGWGREWEAGDGSGRLGTGVGGWGREWEAGDGSGRLGTGVGGWGRCMLLHAMNGIMKSEGGSLNDCIYRDNWMWMGKLGYKEKGGRGTNEIQGRRE